MKLLVAAGTAAIIAGGFLGLFGTVHSTSYYFESTSVCGAGCFSSSLQDVPIGFYLYPIWSQPNFSQVDYSVLNCDIRPTWYTPLNPPPSCLFPPAEDSVSYIFNLFGIALAAGGVFMMFEGRWPLPDRRPIGSPAGASHLR